MPILNPDTERRLIRLGSEEIDLTDMFYLREFCEVNATIKKLQEEHDKPGILCRFGDIRLVVDDDGSRFVVEIHFYREEDDSEYAWRMVGEVVAGGDEPNPDEEVERELWLKLDAKYGPRAII